jgi:predicted Zn-dependent protease
LAASLHHLNRHQDAERVCRVGLANYPHDPELLFRFGMLAHEAGRLEEAAEAYRMALTKQTDRYFASIDQGILGCKARHNLACVYADMERPDLAEIQWRRILAEKPESRPTRLLLVDTLLRAGRLITAEMELAELENGGALDCEVSLLRVRSAEARGEFTQAREQLAAVTNLFPENPAAWEAAGRFLFQHGEPADAVVALSRLVDLQPSNGAALHNLGIAHLRAGNCAASAKALEASLRARPNSPITREQLRCVQEILHSERPIGSRGMMPDRGTPGTVAMSG